MKKYKTQLVDIHKLEASLNMLDHERFILHSLFFQDKENKYLIIAERAISHSEWVKDEMDKQERERKENK